MTVAPPAGAFATVASLAFLFNRLGGVVGVRVGVGEVAAGVAGGDVREASSVALAAGDHETGVRIAHFAFRVAAGAEPDECASGVDEGERSSALTVQLESLRGGPQVMAYPTEGRVRFLLVRAERAVDGSVCDGIGWGDLG